MASDSEQCENKHLPKVTVNVPAVIMVALHVLASFHCSQVVCSELKSLQLLQCMFGEGREVADKAGLDWAQLWVHLK